MATCETGQDRPGPLHVHNSSSGKSKGFLLKTGKRKCCAFAPRLPFSKEIKGKVLYFRSWALEHLPECVDCQMPWQDHLLNLSARCHSSADGSGGSVVVPHAHLCLLQVFFKAARVRA